MAYKLKQDISIGANLKKYRQKAGLSQENVAAKLQLQEFEIIRENISQMERGICNVRISVLLALAELYNVPIQNFFANLDRYES